METHDLRALIHRLPGERRDPAQVVSFVIVEGLELCGCYAKIVHHSHLDHVNPFLSQNPNKLRVGITRGNNL